MGIFGKAGKSNKGEPQISESRFIVFAGEFLDGFENQVETSKVLLLEMQESESTGPEDDLFLEVYEKSISAFLVFRASFSDELSIGHSITAPLVVPNPFKLFQIVQKTASAHLEDGPTLMKVMVNSWHDLNQAAAAGALPMFPGQGLRESLNWRGTKLSSVMRAAAKFDSKGDVQKQADTMTVNAITTAFTAGIDRYGLGEPGSMMASISTSLILTWKASTTRNQLAI